MGFFNKLFGGDEGIREAMKETYYIIKRQHPDLLEHEVLSIVLHHRYKVLPAEIAAIVSVLFPTIYKLTEWVVGLEKSGLGWERMTWPNATFNRYFFATSTVEEREKALDFIQNNQSDTIKNMMLK
jgi:hypothetical protein